MYESIEIPNNFENSQINMGLYHQKGLIKQNSNISSNTKNTSTSTSYMSDKNNSCLQNF